MRDFVAIDFETANREFTSACSVGVVKVTDGEIIDSFYSLIHPYPNYYLAANSEIHGLTQKDTEEAPRFDEVWQTLAPFISDLPLVAHNKGFDGTVLRRTLALYGLSFENEFFCTCIQSRRVLGNILENHKLNTVANYFGFTFEHHHALEDARACAFIALRVFAEPPQRTVSLQ
jgi:hypothetical protein